MFKQILKTIIICGLVASVLFIAVFCFNNKETVANNTDTSARSKCPSTTYHTQPVALSCVNNEDYSKVICTICQAGYKCVIFDANNCRY